jgi:hypothetical protein
MWCNIAVVPTYKKRQPLHLQRLPLSLLTPVLINTPAQTKRGAR